MVGLVGVKARVQQTGFQVVLARKAMKGRSKGESANRKRAFRSTRESERTLARCFKTVRFGHRPQVAGRIRVLVWGVVVFLIN